MALDRSLNQQLDRSMPVAPLAIIALPSARQLGEKISSYISDFRRIDSNSEEEIPYRDNYYQDSYLMDVNLERFQTGEGRAVMLESARGKDVFILVDVMNWTVTYKMNGFVNHMSPDDHYAETERIKKQEAHCRNCSGHQHHD